MGSYANVRNTMQQKKKTCTGQTYVHSLDLRSSENMLFCGFFFFTIQIAI